MSSQPSKWDDVSRSNLDLIAFVKDSETAGPCTISPSTKPKTHVPSVELSVPDVTDSLESHEDDGTGDESAEFPDLKFEAENLTETSGPLDGAVELDETDTGDNDCIVLTCQPTMNIFKSGKIQLMCPSNEYIKHLLGNNPVILCNTTTPLSSPIKLSTVSQLDQLDDRLEQDPAYRQSLLLSLKKQGGKTKNSVTTKALRFLLTDSLAAQYNWIGSFKKGHTGVQKKSFKALKHVTALIINAGLNLFHPTADDEDEFVRALEEIIKTWLKQAPGRIQSAEKNKSSIKAETSHSSNLNETDEEGG